MSFSTPILQTPGLSWKGVRSEATRELATRIDAVYMKALQPVAQREFWGPFVSYSSLDEDEEIAKFPIDFEDLGLWQPLNGQRVARGPKDLLYALGVAHPFYKDRVIPTSLLRRGKYGDHPDRIAKMMIAHRRTLGALFRDALFATGASGTGSTIYTYQGGRTGTQPIVARSGHWVDPAEGGASQTFGNCHTGSDQAAAGNALAVKGATPLNAANWELIRKEYRLRPGPGGVPLDMQPNFILGGARMEGPFKRLFGRALVLEDSGAKDAAAALDNIFSQLAGAAKLSDFGDEPTIPVISGWLDAHPYAAANPTAHQYWTMSTGYAARPFGIVLGDGGAPRIKVLDEGSEYEVLNDAIYIKGDASAGIVGLFPHVFDEWRGT